MDLCHQQDAFGSIVQNCGPAPEMLGWDGGLVGGFAAGALCSIARGVLCAWGVAASSGVCFKACICLLSLKCRN